MLIIAGQPYNVSCDFYDNHSGYTVVFNHTKYHKQSIWVVTRTFVLDARITMKA